VVTGNGNGNGNGRLTSNQYKYILKLNEDLGRSTGTSWISAAWNRSAP
jgi:hypothetical protein